MPQGTPIEKRNFLTLSSLCNAEHSESRLWGQKVGQLPNWIKWCHMVQEVKLEDPLPHYYFSGLRFGEAVGGGR